LSLRKIKNINKNDSVDSPTATAIKSEIKQKKTQLMLAENITATGLKRKS